MSQTHQMDPMYKKLENSLRTIYDYPDVYIEEHPTSQWYVPYLLPQTRSEADVPQFLEFAKKVKSDYPKSDLHKLKPACLDDFKADEPITHPVVLKIWRIDEDDINKRADNNEKYVNKQYRKSETISERILF